MPVVRTLSYDSPYKQYASVPEYLRWEYGEGGKRLPFGSSFFSEGRGRMLVAKATFAPSDTCFHLYRIDTKTLAVIDSGTADLRRDVYRVWSGPTIGRTTIVPAGESGYWVFTLTSNKEYWRAFMPVSDTPAPTVVAYRFSRDLKAVHPTRAVRVEAKPFASAKQDGVVSVTSASRGIPRYELGTRAMLTTLKLDFAAFDRDGELYTQTYEDSITSRVTK
jgi:hypothetical protein